MRPDDERFISLGPGGRGRKAGGRAIYHMKVRTASRSKGQSARAAAAYIERTEEYSRDPERAAELVYTESGHMPGWADADAGGVAYWDAADLYERNNGRLYKSVEIALPLALSAAAQRDLAVQFAHHLTDAEQLPYTLAIHAGKGENPHCHLMISERTNDDIERSPATWFKRYNAAAPEDGGARKTTALHPKDWLLETRAAWAAQTNQALERAGHAIRIDHRSLEAQGIDRVPGIHLGPQVLEMEARGIQTERGQLALAIAATNAQLQIHARARSRESPAEDITPAEEKTAEAADRPAEERDKGREEQSRENRTEDVRPAEEKTAATAEGPAEERDKGRDEKSREGQAEDVTPAEEKTAATAEGPAEERDKGREPESREVRTEAGTPAEEKTAATAEGPAEERDKGRDEKSREGQAEDVRPAEEKTAATAEGPAEERDKGREEKSRESPANEQIQIRAQEEGREDGGDRQNKESQRVGQPRPRDPPRPEPDPPAPERPERGAERPAQGTPPAAARPARGAARVAKPDGGVAAGHQRSDGRHLADDPAAGRGAAKRGGVDVTAGAGRLGPGDGPGAPAPAGPGGRMEKLLLRQERQESRFLWGLSRERWTGLVFGLVFSAGAGIFGGVIYRAIDPPSKAGTQWAADRAALEADLSTYRQKWDAVRPAEQKRAEKRLADKQAAP